MLVRTLDDLQGTKGAVRTAQWSSMRFLHREDGMGFTMTETRLVAGMDAEMEYKNHLEACYVIEGEGTIEELATGKVHALAPGTLYALDKHDRHRLIARTAMRLVCCFAPALTGGEVHRADGSYAAGE